MPFFSFGGFASGATAGATEPAQQEQPPVEQQAARGPGGRVPLWRRQEMAYDLHQQRRREAEAVRLAEAAAALEPDAPQEPDAPTEVLCECIDVAYVMGQHITVPTVLVAKKGKEIIAPGPVRDLFGEQGHREHSGEHRMI